MLIFYICYIYLFRGYISAVARHSWVPFFPIGSHSQLLLRCSSFSAHHLSNRMALSMRADKDNNVINNDVGSWPWWKGVCFLAYASLWLNATTPYTKDTQHFSSTLWLGVPVKLWAQTIKIFLQYLFGIGIFHYSLWCPHLLREKAWNTWWISAKWIDVQGKSSTIKAAEDGES